MTLHVLDHGLPLNRSVHHWVCLSAICSLAFDDLCLHKSNNVVLDQAHCPRSASTDMTSQPCIQSRSGSICTAFRREAFVWSPPPHLAFEGSSDHFAVASASEVSVAPSKTKSWSARAPRSRLQPTDTGCMTTELAALASRPSPAAYGSEPA